MAPSTFFIFASTLSLVFSGCNKKSENDEESADLSGATSAVVVGGKQPVRGTRTVVSSGGQVKVVAVDDNNQIVGAKPSVFRVLGPTEATSAQPTISWTAADSVESYSVKVATDTACSNVVSQNDSLTELTWTIDQVLSLGDYYICIEASNNYGVQNASNNGFLMSVGPGIEREVAIVSSDDYVNSINASTYSVSGTCNIGDIVVFGEDVGGTSIEETVACDNEEFSATIDISSLQEGTITIAARNDTVTDAVAKTKDTVLPVVNAPADDLTPTNDVSWTWTCSEANCIFRHVVDTVIDTDPSGAFGSAAAASHNTGNGSIYLHIQAKDQAGNLSLVTHATAVMDTTPPTLTINALANVNASGEDSYSLSGTCDESGESVDWSIDDVNIGTSAITGSSACDGSSWSQTGVDLSSLDDGSLNVLADLSDAVGNQAMQQNGSFSKDTVAPALLFTSVPTVNSINVSNYDFSGTCDETSGSVSWSVDDDGNGATAAITGSATCNGSAFSISSINLSSLDEGNLTFAADLSDGAGNSTSINEVHLKNTLAPSLNLTPPGHANLSNYTSFSLSGLCDVNTATVEWSIDDQNGGTSAITGTATCNGTSWSSTGINLTTLDDDDIDITVDMDDLSSNPAPTEAASVKKDLVVPTVAYSAPSAANNTNKSSYTISGTCDENSGTVNYSIDDQGNGSTAAITGTASCDGSNWSASAIDVSSLDDGTMDLTANLDDVAGNSATQATTNGTKDTVLPTVAITAPGDVVAANETSFSIAGTCSENGETVNISVDDVGNGATAAIVGSDTCSSSAWSISLNLSSLDEGTLNVDVDHDDAAGNQNLDSDTANKDTTSPSVPDGFVLQSPVSNLSNDTAPVLRFTGLEGTETIRIWDDGSCTSEVESATAVASTLNIALSLSVDGTYNYKATAEDSLGNRSACSSTTVTYTMDRAINAVSGVTLVDPASSPASDNTPTVRVSGIESGDTVKLYTSSNCFGSEQIGFSISSGSTIDITVDTDELTSDGVYSIHARSNDAAGNFSSCSASFLSYTLDTSPPSAPTGVTKTAPAGSPGVDTTPTFQVDGLTSGFVVKLYNGSDCSDEIGSTTATGSSETFDTDVLSIDGTYQVYATQTDLAGNESACSTANDSYTLDISNPTLSSIHIESNGGSNLAGIGNDAIITFTASEPLQTQTVTIQGKSASVVLQSGTTYVATYTFIASDTNGAVTFTIDYTDFATNSGTQRTSTTDASALTFDNTKYAPSLNESNQSVDENSAHSQDINDTYTANDTDNDGDSITYSNCYYDTTVDGAVSTSQNCTSLSGFTLNSSTGVIDWTPSYTDAGVYELRVVGNDGSLSGETVFTLIVNNVNRLPVLASIADQEFGLADTFNFDMYDTNTSNDTDIDGETLTYTCIYDTTVDGDVLSGSNCSDLDGIDFNGTTGSFQWTVQPTTPGNFEFKVIANDGIDTAGEVFSVLVEIDVSKLTQLSMVGSSTTSYVASLANDNEVTLNGDPIGGGSTPTIYAAGDTFSISTSAGDVLECSAGCYTITPVEGTAAWSTQAYSGTLLSTYMGRYTYSKIVIAAYDQAANITIKQNGVTHDSGLVAANSIGTFSGISHSVGSLWIESDAPISAYISSSNNTAYDRDGRIMTTPGKEVLAFVSGGGGTPAAISTTEDNTTANAYRNDGTNFLNQNFDIADIVTVTHTSASQNAVASALAVYSDKPVVVTQHADGDGTNATPSLPKSMLSTHFVTPMDGDYVSFASFEQGEVIILDNTDTVISRTTMTRDAGADPLAPYGFTHNPTLISTGTRYVCTTPCLGIFEPDSNDDETLMTGTTLEGFSISSTDFTDGGAIPSDFFGQAPSECSSDNDFPNLTWANVPWGTKAIAILVEDETNSNFVHLNVVDIDPTLGSVGKLEATGGTVTFPAGSIEGTNGYATSGWSGPCDTSGTHTYRLKIYALSAAIGSAVNNTTMASFESTYASSILGSASMTGTK